MNTMDTITMIWVGIIWIIVGAFLLKVIFRVEDRMKQSNIQIELLAKIAKHSGVPVDEIRQILGIKKPKIDKHQT